MSREIRIAIIGMILGILSTVATEEMRCFFKLSKTSKCHQCLQSINITDSHDVIIGFIIIVLVVAIVIPSNDSGEELIAFFLCGGATIAGLIVSIYGIASCF
ncbi:MAG: hypothetical protein ACRCU2_10495 [Planktothrix sp.]